MMRLCYPDPDPDGQDNDQDLISVRLKLCGTGSIDACTGLYGYKKDRSN
jgi:hypothetical protein